MGRILSTSNANVPAPLATDTEYWEVDLSKMANQAITIRLVAQAVLTAPTPLSVPDRFSARPVYDSAGVSGTLPGGALTWRSVGANPLPAFRIDTGATETEWIRDPSYGELFASAAVNDTLDFQVSANLSYTNKRRTVDDWGPMPY